MENCFRLHVKLMNHKWAGPFLHPVDPVALHIPDYFDIIKNPMDLGTIYSRLLSGALATESEYLTLTRRVFDNAILYNKAQDDVAIMAKTLSDYFEREYAHMNEMVMLESGDVNTITTRRRSFKRSVGYESGGGTLAVRPYALRKSGSVDSHVKVVSNLPADVLPYQYNALEYVLNRFNEKREKMHSSSVCSIKHAQLFLFLERRVLLRNRYILVHHAQERPLLLLAVQRHHERLLSLRTRSRLDAHAMWVLRVAPHRRVLPLTFHHHAYPRRRVIQQDVLALALVPLLVRVHGDSLLVDHEERVQPGSEEATLSERKRVAHLVLHLLRLLVLAARHAARLADAGFAQHVVHPVVHERRGFGGRFGTGGFRSRRFGNRRRRRIGVAGRQRNRRRRNLWHRGNCRF